MPAVCPPEHADTWIAISPDVLPAAEAAEWAIVDRCGGIVTFCGTVRDHARTDGGDLREDVSGLEYEAYEAPAVERMTAIAAEVRRRWPDVGRIALLHRVGRLALRETAVVVTISAPHRAEAFESAHWAIDTLKETVPIWKKEEWAGGSDWGADAKPVDAVPGSVR